MITFKIVTPNGVTYEDDIEKVTIPTGDGEITVLESHAPLVSTLAPGEVLVHKNGHVIALAISTGILEIRPNSEVYLLADTSERAEHIDIERAEAAKARAEELLKRQENDLDIDFARIQSIIERETARISVGRRYRDVR
ncbi:MAG TPA: ATP synthase F1 subunit epsilon [Candidatus Magasanikbacteria bacterium]|uniref:ATP synthase epsilon chain n=1 Tax=Candidatus Magasanikbacteria bacterium GW2011_GWE2_42_7 TaxID=1619052 RepID=A0A0G1DLY9_9BACT|nr:MAG: ATP synthase epsilon chain [Candidatus Magasanikbacteria bacterium GW2011_GWC2_42_27]KKS71856.1 MAG: ATP synthase epsilon chain [Candidatus Magasanikbacteria bacterium GW2011_GWE2_42_7]KKT26018.1 MAG: ATP synthase epsilon chain [Candidatus Magasanikbacteria bacterium GW2011_GWA2_43_9]HBB37699.1 ATP synthase F1 subunit epsilon [Candidatus Magasanikbacteria bacterium]HCC13301.1 ATP synthase F1 subunit epsilon [Candidatus Magasanikbacteria bacterium]